MFTKKQVLSIKNEIKTMERAKEVLEAINLSLDIQSDKVVITFGPDNYSQIFKKDKLQLRFPVEQPEEIKIDRENIEQVVEYNTPVCSADDISHLLDKHRYLKGTQYDHSYIIDDIKFLEAGISPEGVYLNILTDDNYILEPDGTIVIPFTSYENVLPEVPNLKGPKIHINASLPFHVIQTIAGLIGKWNIIYITDPNIDRMKLENVSATIAPPTVLELVEKHLSKAV